MKHCIKKSIAILALVYFSAPFAYASWPVFAAPDANFLVRNNYITTAGCPAGQGKLLANTMFNIHANLCKTFCPEDWAWLAQSDDQCHDLKNGFQFKQFNIEHIADEKFDDAEKRDRENRHHPARGHRERKDDGKGGGDPCADIGDEAEHRGKDSP